MADVRRRLAALVLGGAVVLSGCGGPPSQDDFVAKIKESMGTDLADGMKAQNIDAETGDQLINEFINCQFVQIKGDSDLLQKAYDDPGDVNIAAQLDIKAQKCVDALSSAMAKATGTTTTTIPVPAPETEPATEPGEFPATEAAPTTTPGA